MSSTGRGRERQSDDTYITPAWCVHSILSELSLLETGTFLEPCAADGSLIRACRPFVPEAQWKACEIREECWDDLSLEVGEANLYRGNFLDAEVGRVDVVITNPPYSLAMEFVEKCIRISNLTVMLLRLNFLGSMKRNDFFRSHAPDVYVLSKRPSFILNKTDSTEYAWFVFHHEPRTEGRLMVLSPPVGEIYNASKGRRDKSGDRETTLPEVEVAEGQSVSGESSGV